MRSALALTASLLILAAALCTDAAHAQQKEAGVYEQWENGPPADPGFFPMAVWLQDPGLAGRYAEAGITVYVGLWRGPTEAQLADLKSAGMYVVCAQNDVGLQHLDDRTIIGWMHGDEPDNAHGMERYWRNDVDAANKAWPDVPDRTLEQWGTYGPPVPPVRIIADYEKIKSRDPSRPILLNLGRGVSDDNYIGRGCRRRRLEDYPEYIKGCDIASYDIYPVKSAKPEFHGNLWYVPKGVDRLVKWSEGRKIVWNCVEASAGSGGLITPYQLRAEVWMSLIHGSTGIIYFVHEFGQNPNEHALLDHPELLAGTTAVNRQIHQLAPVLNSPTIENGAQVTPANADVPVDLMVKRHDGATYVFAVAMRDGQTTASFAIDGLPTTANAEALGEGRQIQVHGGRFQDDFKGYEVHLYRVE